MSDVPKDTTPPPDNLPAADVDSAPKEPASFPTVSQEVRNIRGIQGDDMPPESKPIEPLSSQNFTDAKGRHLRLQDFPNGDVHYFRVFDEDRLNEAQKPEPRPSDSIAHANLYFERDSNGRIDRARLQDIFTAENYRKAGIGDFMLEQSELLASKNGAREIYGSPQDEVAREWFIRRGYHVRNNGAEIYKTLRH